MCASYVYLCTGTYALFMRGISLVVWPFCCAAREIGKSSRTRYVRILHFLNGPEFSVNSEGNSRVARSRANGGGDPIEEQAGSSERERERTSARGLTAVTDEQIFLLAVGRKRPAL